MLTMPQQIADRIGYTAPDAATVDLDPCAICGGLTSHGAPVDDVCGSLTTDLTSFRAPDSAHVCDGCILVRGRAVNPPTRESGWFCNFSHFIDADRYENASKGEKPRILAWLRGEKRGPWACVIADTGQKHLVCYAPINPPGSRGRVRFEEADVALPSEDGWRIVDDLVALLTAGATKEEIETGRYSARAHALCGDAVQAFERTHGRLRGGAWLSLALWLAQRDEATVQARLEAEKQAKAAKKAKPARARKAASDGGGRGDEGADPVAPGGDAFGVPAGLPADDGSEHVGALADHPGPDASGGEADEELRRVGDQGAAPTPDSTTGQLGLFGAAGAEPRRARGRRVA